MDGKIYYFRSIEKQIAQYFVKEIVFKIDALKSYYQQKLYL
jgi:hypothetical protein